MSTMRASGRLHGLRWRWVQHQALSTCRLRRWSGGDGGVLAALGSRSQLATSETTFESVVEDREGLGLVGGGDEGKKYEGLRSRVALSLRENVFGASIGFHLLAPCAVRASSSILVGQKGASGMFRELHTAVAECGGARVPIISSCFSCSRPLLTSPVCCCERRCGYASAASEKPQEAGGHNGKETISVTFVSKDGDEKEIKVPVGMSMLEAAHENDIELEGACEGSLACSTCHVIVTEEAYYNKLPEPSDEENDMLDLAFGLTETSRLGCQVIAKPELNGLRLALPAATRNFAVDGHVPKPH